MKRRKIELQKKSSKLFLVEMIVGPLNIVLNYFDLKTLFSLLTVSKNFQNIIKEYLKRKSITQNQFDNLINVYKPSVETLFFLINNQSFYYDTIVFKCMSLYYFISKDYIKGIQYCVNRYKMKLFPEKETFVLFNYAMENTSLKTISFMFQYAKTTNLKRKILFNQMIREHYTEKYVILDLFMKYIIKNIPILKDDEIKILTKFVYYIYKEYISKNMINDLTKKPKETSNKKTHKKQFGCRYTSLLIILLYGDKLKTAKKIWKTLKGKNQLSCLYKTRFMDNPRHNIRGVTNIEFLIHHCLENKEKKSFVTFFRKTLLKTKGIPRMKSKLIKSFAKYKYVDKENIIEKYIRSILQHKTSDLENIIPNTFFFANIPFLKILFQEKFLKMKQSKRLFAFIPRLFDSDHIHRRFQNVKTVLNFILHHFSRLKTYDVLPERETFLYTSLITFFQRRKIYFNYIPSDNINKFVEMCFMKKSFACIQTLIDMNLKTPFQCITYAKKKNQLYWEKLIEYLITFQDVQKKIKKPKEFFYSLEINGYIHLYNKIAKVFKIPFIRSSYAHILKQRNPVTVIDIDSDMENELDNIEADDNDICGIM
jgi:hypothetical protein